MFKEPEDFIVEELPLYEPSGTGTHTYFAIRKRNFGTLEAINRIARELQVSTRNFGYAGLKDKYAVTIQVLSVDGVAPEQVLEIEQRDIEVLWAERHAHKLRVGHLRGNRFALMLRDIPHDRLSLVKTVMAGLVTEGVPNRFGAQRFGRKNDSHLIGKALLKAEWETVLNYMLTADPLQVDDVARRMRRELARKPVDRVITTIPHRLRKLYLSAYQAHLFNSILEKRMPHLGKLIEGDIAVKHSNGAPFLVPNPTIEQPRADTFEISPSGPIFGYKMRMPTGDALTLETSLLTDEGVRFEQFRKVVGIRLPGTRRPLRMPIQLHEVSATDSDLGVRLRFTLPAGGYATVVVEELLAGIQSSGRVRF
ncbi:tRNA pseudouridine(13) synthase TruD [Candidatus Poribacteria bacterium]|nr:tRNA pseudouridine(13) synthase TruD [Candidatus Poribacteria bacterium]